MTAIDDAATAWINGFAGERPWLDLFMLTITNAGVVLMVAAVGLSWWLGGDRRRGLYSPTAVFAGRRAARHAAVASGLGFLLGLGLNQIVLLFVHRMRPSDAGISHLLLAPTTDPSFPSDHATAVFAIVLAFIVGGRRLAAIGFLCLALLVVLSRIYLGAHYVSDILGGIITALIATLVVRLCYRPGSRIDLFVTGIL